MPKLYETITLNNWRKNVVRVNDDVGCLVHHLGSKTTQPYRQEYGRRLCEAVRLLFPDRVADYPHESWVMLGRFNDHPDTTVEDVIRVCKVADV